MKAGTCKYFTGTFHNTHCQAGVCYHDVTTEPNKLQGQALRIPCHSIPIMCSPAQLEEFEKRGKCEKYCDPTPDEIAAYEAEMKAHMDKFLLSLPIIEKVKKEHKGKDWKGVEECPVCKGRLHMTHAKFNGHVWGQCETKGCLSWME